MAFSFRTEIRRFFGIDQLEAAMTSITDQLTGLKNQFADFASDVNARLQQLADAQGTFSPDAQVIFDDFKAAVAAADASVGDADGSDTPPPAPTEPTEPVDETPTDQ